MKWNRTFYKFSFKRNGWQFFLSFMLISQMSCIDQTSSKKNSKLSREDLASLEKKDFWLSKLKAHQINWSDVNLFIRGFKREQELEIWAKNTNDSIYQKIIQYDFCKLSGALGPKRKEGDGQVPEGLYYIDRFNPTSNFHLSLGLNYPNASDKIRGDKNQPGSDIFIHGGCVTVGCIPITDDKIKELYILAKQAKTNGQNKIPVNIFPTRMTQDNLKDLASTYPKEMVLWQELKVIYDNFEETKKVSIFKIGTEGEYIMI